MEIVDLEDRLERQIESEITDRETLGEDIYRMSGELNASIDRRTDKLWEEYHNLNDRVKKLDKTVNPNMDKLNN